MVCSHRRPEAVECSRERSKGQRAPWPLAAGSALAPAVWPAREPLGKIAPTDDRPALCRACAAAPCSRASPASAATLRPARAATRGGKLVFGRYLDASYLDPVMTQINAEIWVMQNLFDNLVHSSADGHTIEPAIATKWEISADGLTASFTLRDGVKFADGSPLTADDVKFSLDRSRDPEDRAVGPHAGGGRFGGNAGPAARGAQIAEPGAGAAAGARHVQHLHPAESPRHGGTGRHHGGQSQKLHEPPGRVGPVPDDRLAAQPVDVAQAQSLLLEGRRRRQEAALHRRAGIPDPHG